MIFLAIAAIAFALLNPEVRLWLQNTPPGLNAAVGAFAGTVIGLLGIAAAIIYHAQMERDDKTARQSDDARVLAAAIHGEIVALAQWLAIQASQNNADGRNDLYRSNEIMDGSDSAGFSSRSVYETNAGRLDLLGSDLAAAVAYCHAIFEQAEWQHNAMLSRGTGRSGNLPAVEEKMRATASYLAAFVSGGPAEIDAAGRQALFAQPAGRTDD